MNFYTKVLGKYYAYVCEECGIFTKLASLLPWWQAVES